MAHIPLLTADDIEVKVKKITAKGAIALLYKTARTDMNILDEVFGAENWSCDYSEVKGNLYCTIRVRNENGEWVGKQDCGIESREDGDGNEKKGEASDAFKRAGFRWGIGRELYTAPFIFLSLETYKDGNGYKLKNPYERFSVSDIGYDENRRINRLIITNDNGSIVFSTHKTKPIVPSRKNDVCEEDYKPATLICEVCGSTIVSTKKYSAQQMADGTKKAYGKMMCGVCAAERAKQDQHEI